MQCVRRAVRRVCSVCVEPSGVCAVCAYSRAACVQCVRRAVRRVCSVSVDPCGVLSRNIMMRAQSFIARRAFSCSNLHA